MPRSLAHFLAAQILGCLTLLTPMPAAAVPWGLACLNLALAAFWWAKEKRLTREAHALIAQNTARGGGRRKLEVVSRTADCNACHGTGHGCYRPDCDCRCASCGGSGRILSPRAQA